MESEDISQDTKSLAQNSAEVIDPVPSFSWEASEFVHHAKSFQWYLGLWLFLGVFCVILGFLQQWLSVVVLVVMGVAVVVYSRKEPRTLQYAMDAKGISINGKLSPYSHFRSYNVQAEVGWQEIDLEPTQRFSPRLTLLADAEHFDQIEAILAQHLPRVDRDPDLMERVSRYIKF